MPVKKTAIVMGAQQGIDTGGFLKSGHSTVATSLRAEEKERIRQEKVRMEERARIARELHDTLLQTVSSTSLKLWAIVSKLPPDSKIKFDLDPILQLMQVGIEEGRKAIQGLRSPDSCPLDLVVALSAVRREFSSRPGVDFRVSFFGQQHAFPPTIQREVYRLCRDALVNASAIRERDALIRTKFFVPNSKRWDFQLAKTLQRRIF